MKRIHGNLPGTETGEGDGVAASAHDRLSLILETMTNAGKTGVGLCLSLLADALSGDGEDDDEGVMCWWNGRSSLCVFLLFLCFPVGCLSLVALPPSPFVSSFSFPCPLSPVLLSMLSLSVLCSSISPLSLLVPFIYASAEDGCLQPWLRRNKLLSAGLHVLLVEGVVDDVAANLDCNQHWGGSSPLEETLLMPEDGVLLL